MASAGQKHVFGEMKMLIKRAIIVAGIALAIAAPQTVLGQGADGGFSGMGLGGQNGSYEALIGKTIDRARLRKDDIRRIEGLTESTKGRAQLRDFIAQREALKSLTHSTHSIEEIMSLTRALDEDLETTLQDVTTGVDVGVNHALTTGQDLKSIRLLSPSEIARFRSSEYLTATARSLNIPAAEANTIKTLPVAFGDRPVIQYPDLPGFSNVKGLYRTERDKRNPHMGGQNFSVGMQTVSAAPLPKGGSSNLLLSANFEPKSIGPATAAAFTADENVCGADSGQACFLSAVSLHNSGVVQCSGVQVAPGWVLSAAHCTCRHAPQIASIGQVTPNRHGVAFYNPVIVKDAPRAQAEIYSSHVTSQRYYFGERPGDEEPPRRFCKNHAKFREMPRPSADELGDAALDLASVNPYTLEWLAAREAVFGARDLVLIKLGRALSLRGHTPVAKLADAPLFGLSKQYRIAGFGRNNWEASGGHKTILFGEHVGSACESLRVRVRNGCATGLEMILQHKERETDSCNGDSGAGVFRVMNDASLRLTAIVSRAAEGATCGPGGVNVIVASDQVKQWIAEIVGAG